MIRRGFLAVDPMLLEWILRASESARQIPMSAEGNVRHWQGHEECKSLEIPFLRVAASLTGESTPLAKARWWANVLRTGAGYRPHRHDGKWSFAYHLTEGATLHFDGCDSFPAIPGQILVFDSKLRHWTDKVEGDAPRVSIAGNLHFKSR